MSKILELFDLAPSPNNVKVRLALGYKGIPHERIEIDPMDRSQLIAMSGQPLSPVIRHGETVLFDSHAIIRYLDANFAQGERLFSPVREEMRAIETWEHHARGPLAEPVAIMFGQFFADPKDPAEMDRACRLIHEATAGIEERLGSGPWLLGERLTAADLFCIPAANLAALTDATAGDSQILAFFREHFDLGAGRERTRDWVARGMVHDA